VASDGNGKCPANRFVPSKVRVGNPCTEEGHNVDPELIESSNTSRSSLAEIQGPGLAIVTGSSARALREWLLDVVGDWQLSATGCLSQWTLTYKLP
jgi:hypothetical protein